MKTSLFSFGLILILSAPIAMAQSTDKGKISFAILGGVNFQNLNGKDAAGDRLKNGLIIGYHAGVNIQIPVVPQFFFQPGLLYSLKGAKITEGSESYKVKISYIELPLNFVYKAMLGKGYFFLGFGPYMGYAIGGKTIPESGSATDIEFKKVVETGDPETVKYYKRFDAGGNIFTGYELANGIFCQLDAQLGMLKINSEDNRISDDKSSVKNTGFGLSIGYRF